MNSDFDFSLRKDTEDSKEAEGSPDKETGNLDFLNRIQELEVELEETRQQNIADNKSRAEDHKKEIEDLREDMAKVLQVSLVFLKLVDFSSYKGVLYF